MALTIETGLIVAGADSYASVADADTYHTNNGTAAWALASNEAKEAALRKACRYLDGRYRARWKGRRVQPVAQALEWPRGGVCIGETYPAGNATHDVGFGGEIYIPYDSIPQRLKDAQCELALRALDGDLAADASTGVKREKVDIIDTEYFAGAVPGQTAYVAVEQLISDYLITTGNVDLLRG